MDDNPYQAPQVLRPVAAVPEPASLQLHVERRYEPPPHPLLIALAWVMLVCALIVIAVGATAFLH